MLRELKANEGMQMATGEFSAKLSSVPAKFSYSADGVTYTEYVKDIDDTTLVVVGMPQNMFIKFNVDAQVNYR